MSQHSNQCAITTMALWALAASGCSLALDASEYEPAPGTEQPDARQPGSARVDAAGTGDGGASYMDAQGLPDAVCDVQPQVSFSPCLDASDNAAQPSQMHFLGTNNDTRLHLIGVYEANPRSTERKTNVFFSYPGSNVLVLSAFESITWDVAVGSQGSLDKIYLVGVNPQMGSFPTGIPVEIVGAESPIGCGYELPTSVGNTACNTELHINHVKTLTGLVDSPLSYSGCYQAPTNLGVVQSCSNQ